MAPLVSTNKLNHIYLKKNKKHANHFAALAVIIAIIVVESVLIVHFVDGAQIVRFRTAGSRGNRNSIADGTSYGTASRTARDALPRSVKVWIDDPSQICN